MENGHKCPTGNHSFRGRMIDRCFIIGRGPSLKDFDFSLLDGEYKISVNHFRGDPDAVVFLDQSFIKRPELRDFTGEIYYGDRSEWTGRGKIIKTSPGARNNLSGLEAIHIGLEMAETVYLLGFDFTPGGAYFDTGGVHFCYENEGWRERRLKRFKELPRDRVFIIGNSTIPLEKKELSQVIPRYPGKGQIREEMK